MADRLRAVDRESGVAETKTGTQTSRALLTELPETAHCHAALKLPKTYGANEQS